MSDTFNHEMVQMARESRGWTQTQLSSESGLTQGFISRLEAGEKHASEEKIAALASALSYPRSFFFQRGSYEGFGLSMVFYRKRAKTKVKDLKILQAEKNIRKMQLQRLLDSVDVFTNHRFPSMDIDEHDGAVESIASLVRANWQLPLGPVNNLIQSIERAGGVVYRFDFGTKDIDALSEWPEGMPPLFYLNSNAPMDRARFSLAHELGHVVMHHTASDTMEREADRFAAEFLMPEKQIKSQLENIDIKKAARLKPYWRVSMQAMIYRARDLSQITPTQFTALYKRLGHLGYRKTEPNPISPEHPKLLNKVFSVFESTNEFSYSDMARLFCVTENELPRYRPDRGGLRIA